jgi:hypothetical protein
VKKIIISIVLLLAAIVTMAYLYFSNLNTSQNTSDISLQAVSANSGFVFSFQNDQSVLDLLKSQELFKEILGQGKYKQLSSIKTQLLSVSAINQSTAKTQLYISFIADRQQEINFLIATQINESYTSAQILQAVRKNGIQTDSLQGCFKLGMPDSSICFIGIEKNLVLVSNTAQPVLDGLKRISDHQPNEFANYIRENSRFTKNSLAQLYLNFNRIPALLSAIIQKKLSGELAVFNQQHTFAALNYSYSNQNILLTGNTELRQKENYYQLFASQTPQKVTITNILPDHTANFTTYTMSSYPDWRKELENWFKTQKQSQLNTAFVKNINDKYHLNLDDIFPKYVANQFLSFQLSTGEKLGAISLSNGDKTQQLLLDLSEDYNEHIKSLKEADLLYHYFGQAFVDFKKPYYVILDNYMVFANQPASLQVFLDKYQNNKLLINSNSYISSSNQLPNNSSISFYIDYKNSLNLFKENLWPKYYEYLRSKTGLSNYNALTYQLSGDQGKFQTNILIDKQPRTLEKDSLDL